MKPTPNAGPVRSDRLFSRVFMGLFGAFLGLSLLKFGNPVILDWKVESPTTLAGLISDPWPVRWGYWLLAVVALFGLPALARAGWPRLRVLYLLLLAWLAWQFIAASKTIDASLTQATLPHLAVCVVCFFLGLLVVAHPTRSQLLWTGIIVGFSLTLVKGVNQHNFEYRRDYQMVLQGDRVGWKDATAEIIQKWKSEGILIETENGIRSNPVIVERLRRGRISGTLVYPNALAGAILLLFPAALSLVIRGTGAFRPVVRILAGGLGTYLGLGCLFWTGSKGGWLIALGMAGAYVFARLPGSRRKKLTVVALAGLLGLTVFVIRFSDFLFVNKAPSVSARFGFWKAAIQNTRDNPIFGSGPGTFWRAYRRLKSPEAEMSRLAHNDYLQQASDSGLPGFLLYTVFVAGSLFHLTRRIPSGDFRFPVLLGLLGWFSQGLIEFGLYIPGLAWPAFSLLGWLLATSGKQIDKPLPAG